MMRVPPIAASGVVERRRVRRVADLDSEMVEHPEILSSAA
jgi:hypothetical protein